MAITPIINSMISKANETTGNSDANLTSAIQHLIDGYGQGGSSGGSEEITLYDGDIDVNTSATSATNVATLSLDGDLTNTDLDNYVFIALIKNKNDVQIGDIFGCSASALCVFSSNGSITSVTLPSALNYYMNSSNGVSVLTGGYGLFPYQISKSNKTLIIRARCRTEVPTINGTFRVVVKKVKIS